MHYICCVVFVYTRFSLVWLFVCGTKNYNVAYTFFIILYISCRWSPKTTHNGKPWTGPDQFEDATGKLMMLPSDMVLILDPEFKKYVELFAKDEDAFFREFSKAFAKLLELGVPFAAIKPWYQFW